MTKLEPSHIPLLEPFGEWVRALLEPRGITPDGPWLILFDDLGEPGPILAGDDARLFAWGKSRLPELTPSPHIFYDPYDMPEWFYFSWHELDIFALLVRHGVFDATEWDAELPRSWGSKI